jgi:hypothetical protein
MSSGLRYIILYTTEERVMPQLLAPPEVSSVSSCPPYYLVISHSSIFCTPGIRVLKPCLSLMELDIRFPLPYRK